MQRQQQGVVTGGAARWRGHDREGLGGGGGGLHYLFGVAQAWRRQAEAAKGQLPAMGSTV